MIHSASIRFQETDPDLPSFNASISAIPSREREVVNVSVGFNSVWAGGLK